MYLKVTILGVYSCITIVVHCRYSHPSVYNKLPNWISSQLLITTSFGQSFSALRKVVTCTLYSTL